jgi:hypothetical protein
MKRYEFLGEVVDAIQFVDMQDKGGSPGPAFNGEPGGWVSDGMNLPKETNGAVWWDRRGFKITTPDGILLMNPGDYIARKEDGEIYSVPPEIFEANYKPVES